MHELIFDPKSPKKMQYAVCGYAMWKKKKKF